MNGRTPALEHCKEADGASHGVRVRPLLKVCQMSDPNAIHKGALDKEALGRRIKVLCAAAEALLEHDPYGESVDAVDVKGWTPLQTAAEFGCLPLVRLLLGRGADVNLQDKKGLTALHWAAGSGYDNPNAADIVAELVQCGADVDAKTHRGESVLACCNGVPA
eukprot:7386040-Prymnesium_polylepis.1